MTESEAAKVNNMFDELVRLLQGVRSEIENLNARVEAVEETHARDWKRLH